MRRVLLIDISDCVASRLGQMLLDRGCLVYHPKTLIEFSRMVSIVSNKGWVGDWVPEIIVNVHSQNTPQVIDTCRVAEMFGIRVMNQHQATTICGDRIRIQCALKQAGIRTPDFFYGYPTHIPKEFSNEVVLKETGEYKHRVSLAKIPGISVRDELIYCERVIPNPTSTIRTVYYICEHIFTVVKTDQLETLAWSKELVNSDTGEIEIIKKIRAITSLDMFNVDFLDGVVIDVNTFPNFFPYPAAVKAVVDEIVEMPLSQPLMF